jgi:Ras GTPase-activating-like protein IQGAP2/3
MFLLRQEEVKQWIEENLGIDINLQNTDFIEELKNGFYLSSLANFISGNIKKVHNGKKGNVLEFMMASDNINNFFDECKKLNFPNIYLFSLSDLWERKNPLNVIYCLHALAHFTERRGLIKYKIKNISENEIKFSKEDLDKVEEEFKKLEKNGINIDLSFDNIKEKKESNNDLEKDNNLKIDPLKCIFEGILNS